MTSPRPALERVGLTLVGVLVVVLSELVLRGVAEAPTGIVWAVDLVGLALAASGPGIAAVARVVDVVLRRGGSQEPPHDTEAR